MRDALTAATVRCRLRKLGIVIELDRDTHDRVDEAQKLALRDALQHLSRQCSIDATTIEFAPYARGSAFIKGHA